MYLMVCLSLHVLAVHLHQTVTRAQPRRLRRGRALHFPYVLSGFPFLSVQMKPVAALSFLHHT